MRAKLQLVLSFPILFFSLTAIAQEDMWEGVSTTDGLSVPFLSSDELENAHMYRLDEKRLKNDLIGTHALIAKKSIVNFPDEDGDLEAFQVEESSVFAPELAARYPGIRSYKGYKVSDPKIKIHFSVSHRGLQTMITNPRQEHHVYLQKVRNESDHYILYERKTNPLRTSDFVCQTKAGIAEALYSAARVVDDGMLRTYRLAVSTTGEYTQFHGGTVADALAAINATMTRVNAIFENDLAIRMELVANNDLVIFTNPGTDPYSGNFNSEVQNTLTSNIGELNYDIGHLFHQDSNNGNAGFIGSVCRDNQKGSAFSSGQSPQGDQFDLDYVAHEMGHQFGANHTWSFESEGTEVQVEPASGTTLMAYAGIVGGNNVAGNSDDYFHYKSIEQITAYVQSTSCAVTSTLSNTAPVISSTGNFNIPVGTAFVLTATATDADSGDVLTYCWEQTDNGIVTASSFGPDQAAGANFRSLRPTEDPSRYFPRLSRIAQGQLTQINPGINDAWETVSDIERDLNFGLTVRDNAPGGGQVASDEITVRVLQNAGPFRIISQSNTEVYEAGTSQEIVWDVANTQSLPIAAERVDIFLSVDGGQSFPVTLVENVPNDGSQHVLLPGITTTLGRVMVKASDNIFLAVNSANFTITESPIVLQLDQLDYEVCAPADLDIPFEYQTYGGFDETVTFSASNVPPGGSISFSPPSATNNGTQVTARLANTDSVVPGTYPITLSATGSTASKAIEVQVRILDATFNTITLLSPVDAAVDIGTQPLLSWEADANATSYDVEVANDSGFTNIVFSGNSLFNEIQIPKLMSDTVYFWRVKPKNSCGEGVFGTAFSFTTVIVDCATFSARDVPIEISSSGTPTISSTINVINDLPVADVDVNLNLDHTFLSDLTIRLRSPSGTEVVLISNSCGTASDLVAVFDDEAPPFVCSDNPAISGTVQPIGSLASFNGESALGEWVLIIDDEFEADGGSLNVFDLELCLEGNIIPDTDGDGVFDPDDLCPDTPIGVSVDVDGCPVYRFDPDNFRIALESETCLNQNDAQIMLTAMEALSYTAVLTGPNTNSLDIFTSQFQWSNLSAGTYSLCITATKGMNTYEEQCFDLELTEPEPLNVLSTISQGGALINLTLEGGELYTVEFNGEIRTETGPTIQRPLKEGLNTLKVTTTQACQGLYEETFFLSGTPLIYPNPFREQVSIALPQNERLERVSIFDYEGRLVRSGRVAIDTQNIELGFEGLPSGIYFIQVRSSTIRGTYKVIKR